MRTLFVVELPHKYIIGVFATEKASKIFITGLKPALQKMAITRRIIDCAWPIYIVENHSRFGERFHILRLKSDLERFVSYLRQREDRLIVYTLKKPYVSKNPSINEMSRIPHEKIGFEEKKRS